MKKQVGDDRGDGEVRRRGLLSLSDLVWGRMLDTGMWAIRGPEEQGQAESAEVWTCGVRRPLSLGDKANGSGQRLCGSRIRWVRCRGGGASQS